MFIDICIPRGNELALIEQARVLGTRQLLFLYDALPEKRIEGIRYGTVSDTLKKQGGVISATSNVSRGNVEDKRIRLMFNFENSQRPDSLHYRNSGLNQVLCKIIRERRKIISVSFQNILSSQRREIAFGRIMQNIRLARKYKCSVSVASFAREPHELRAAKELYSFMVCMGQDHAEAMKSLSALSESLSN